MRADNTHNAINVLQAIRLVATDLDGTLLRPGAVISPRTYTTLQRTQQAGIIIVLVSARPPRVLRQIARGANVSGIAICCNGALIYDLDHEAIIQHTPLVAETVSSLIQSLRREIPDLCFACESGLTFKCEPAFYQLQKRLLRKHAPPYIGDALTFCDGPVTKLLILHPTYTVEDLHTRTAHITRDGVTVALTGSPFLEISAPGVHKAWALASLCQQLHIAPAEVMAFGDMPNDLSMLRWAGHGVAVANAHPLLLAEADEVTRSNREDGVALVLERLLAEREPSDEQSDTTSGSACREG